VPNARPVILVQPGTRKLTRRELKLAYTDEDTAQLRGKHADRRKL